MMNACSVRIAAVMVLCIAMASTVIRSPNNYLRRVKSIATPAQRRLVILPIQPGAHRGDTRRERRERQRRRRGLQEEKEGEEEDGQKTEQGEGAGLEHGIGEEDSPAEEREGIRQEETLAAEAEGTQETENGQDGSEPEKEVEQEQQPETEAEKQQPTQAEDEDFSEPMENENSSEPEETSEDASTTNGGPMSEEEEHVEENGDASGEESEQQQSEQNQGEQEVSEGTRSEPAGNESPPEEVDVEQTEEKTEENGATGIEQEEFKLVEEVVEDEEQEELAEEQTEEVETEVAPSGAAENETPSEGQDEDNSKTINGEQVVEITEEEPGDGPLETQVDVLYQGYGVHYVDLWVGSPPQRTTVIVDTGSPFVGFPCDGCEHCGGDAVEPNDEEAMANHLEHYHTDAVFDQAQSTSFQAVSSEDQCWVGDWDDENGTCRASASYSEGSSWEAFEAIDVVYTGGNHNAPDELREKHTFPLHFGCQDSVKGLFEKQLADGIMGMKLSEAGFWRQMYVAGALEQEAFSLCFVRQPHVDRDGTVAGAMVLGGSDTRLHTTKMIYAQQMNVGGHKGMKRQQTEHDHTNNFVVHLEKLYLRRGNATTAAVSSEPPDSSEMTKVQIFEEDLNNGRGIILDSGTTATFLTQKIADHFESTWNQIVDVEVNPRMKFGETFLLTDEQIDELPTIVFQMTMWQPEEEQEEAAIPVETRATFPTVVGQDLDDSAGKSILVAMPPRHYLSRRHNSSDEQRSDTHEYDFNVFFEENRGHGGVLGANFMMGHDILFDIEQDRIGFAASLCDFAAVANDEEAG